MVCKRHGLTPEQASAATGLTLTVVRRIYEDEKMARDVAIQNFDAMIPKIKMIIGLCLENVLNTLQETALDPELRREMFPNGSALYGMVRTALELREFLMEGILKSGAISSQHNYQDTRVVIQELKKRDPIFDYPDLPSVPPNAAGPVPDPLSSIASALNQEIQAESKPEPEEGQEPDGVVES